MYPSIYSLSGPNKIRNWEKQTLRPITKWSVRLIIPHISSIYRDDVSPASITQIRWGKVDSDIATKRNTHLGIKGFK